MDWIRLYLMQTHPQRIVTSDGPRQLLRRRLMALLRLGTKSHRVRDAIVDTGAIATIVPQHVWSEHRDEIDWIVPPTEDALAPWWRAVAGLTGGAIACGLGTMTMTLLDMDGRKLTPVRIVAKLPTDRGQLSHILIGLGGGALDGRKLDVDFSTADARLGQATTL